VAGLQLPVPPTIDPAVEELGRHRGLNG
jgi:hypothetical protein